MNISRAVSGALAAGVLGLMSLSASAASVSYFLDQSNAMPDGVNYLKVTISDSTVNIGDIDFQIDVLTANFPSPGSNFGMQTFSFNYDTALTVGTANIIDIDPSTWTISQNQSAGGGFGKFEFQLNGSGSDRTELLSFSITGVSGDSPGSYAMGSSLTPPAVEYFAAHVAGFNNGAGVTSAQFAGSTPSAVPLPAALWLMGSGLIALGGFIRTKR